MKINYRLSDPDEDKLIMCFVSDGVDYELYTSPPDFNIERLFKAELPTVWSMGEFNDLFLDDQAHLLSILNQLRKKHGN